MPRLHRIVFISLLLAIVYISPWCFGQKIKVNVGLVRNTSFRGPGEYLAASLTKEKIAFADLTAKFRAGEFPFEKINVLIIESYAFNDKDLAKAFSVPEMKGNIHAFVAKGGIVIQFPQPAESEERITWLPGETTAKRVDVQGGYVYINTRNFRIFRSLSTKYKDKKLVLSPDYGLAATNAFEGWRDFHVAAYGDGSENTGSIMEAALGKGRIVLLSVPFDNLPGGSLPYEKVKGIRLLTRNLLNYCADVLNNKGHPFAVTPADEYRKIIFSGHVFHDVNRNGTRDSGEKGVGNAILSNGLSSTKTSHAGSYKIAMLQYRTHFLTLCPPQGYWSLGESYYRHDFTKSAPDDLRKDFPVIQAPVTESESFMFIHCNNFMIRDEEHGAIFAEDLKEINAFAGRASFVVLTGNIIQAGWKQIEGRKQFELASRILRNLRLPLFTAVGTQDWGPAHLRYRDYYDFRGPRYFSFNFGNIHFFILGQEMAPEHIKWFEEEVKLLKNRKVVVFQQKLLGGNIQQLFGKNGVLAVFNGQFAMNREEMHKYEGTEDDTKSAETFECTTSSFNFPGIDRTPRGFRLIAVSGSDIKTDYRIAGISQHIVIASPQPGADLPNGQIKIIVNAYDTAYFISGVECRIASEDGTKEYYRGYLKKSGDWTWTSYWRPENKLSGKCKISVRARDNAGKTWDKQGAFNIAKDRALKPVTLGRDWPQFQGSEEHSGLTEDKLKLPLDLVWTTHTGGLTHISSPVVSGGTVFVGTQYLNSISGNSIVAIDAATGRLRWRYLTDSPIKHTVAVKNGTVVGMSSDMSVYAVDARTGRERWKHDLNRRRGRSLGNGVVIDKDTVYTGDDGYFAGISLKNGEYLWDVNRLFHHHVSVADVPGIWEDFVLVPFRSGMMKLLKESGREDVLKEFDRIPENGPIREQIAIRRTPTIVDDIMYGTNVLHQLRLCAYDLDKNQYLWISNVDVGDVLSSAAVSDGVVVVGTQKGQIVGVDAETGKGIWVFQTGKNITSFIPGKRLESSVTSSPAISNGVAYVGSNDGALYGLDIKTGKVVWKYEIGCPITGSPAISGNALFVTAYDGTVYAFTGQ